MLTLQVLGDFVPQTLCYVPPPTMETDQHLCLLSSRQSL